MSTAEDIAQLKLQEKRLQFPHFNEADAWALGTLMQAEALARKLPIVIDIRHAGRQLFYAALAGSEADNPNWVRRKSNSALRAHKCSYRIGRELLQKGESVLDRGWDPMEHAPHGGSFPIHVIGTGVIGAVTVSGIPQREDHNFTVEMLCRFLNVDHETVRLKPESDA
ncbi:heme-degrading domain-containing protein [Aestuariivirga sp.]|uniref:heme-degrading domain-containing protein n=1 Tax=Aestuariivirga sp. TaxID=2650926 RepID=UPI0039E3F043